MVDAMRRKLLFQLAQQNLIVDGRAAQTFVIKFGTSVLDLHVKNVTAGQLYVFVLKQNKKGFHSILWSDQILNATPADPNPHAVTVQAFIGLRNGQLFAIGPATWNEVTP